MYYKFLIKNNEQEYKQQYSARLKKHGHIPFFNFSHYLINEDKSKSIHYLMFPIDEKVIKTNNYNNIIYRISNEFGDYIYKKWQLININRYLMHIKNNYYLHYHYYRVFGEFDSDVHDEIITRIIYMNDSLLTYDSDNLQWDTLTVKKVNGLLPIEATYEIKRKLPIFIDVINSIKMLDNL